ncbi:hypothetical protein AJ87_16840 [Rhizobium yanglingense]|nr:hypothetical protein AJ87_16840 [Rhizobium yanglingense]
MVIYLLDDSPHCETVVGARQRNFDTLECAEMVHMGTCAKHFCDVAPKQASPYAPRIKCRVRRLQNDWRGITKPRRENFVDTTGDQRKLNDRSCAIKSLTTECLPQTVCVGTTADIDFRGNQCFLVEIRRAE